MSGTALILAVFFAVFAGFMAGSGDWGWAVAYALFCLIECFGAVCDAIRDSYELSDDEPDPAADEDEVAEVSSVVAIGKRAA